MPKLRLSEWGMPTTEYLRGIKLIGRYKYKLQRSTFDL